MLYSGATLWSRDIIVLDTLLRSVFGCTLFLLKEACSNPVFFFFFFGAFLQALTKDIQKFKMKGKTFSFKKDVTYGTRRATRRKGFWRLCELVFSLNFIVFVSLLGFSAVILIACKVILCMWPSQVQLLVHLCKDDLAHCSTYRMGEIVAEHRME
jgi:hypothetical protein